MEEKIVSSSPPPQTNNYYSPVFRCIQVSELKNGSVLEQWESLVGKKPGLKKPAQIRMTKTSPRMLKEGSIPAPRWFIVLIVASAQSIPFLPKNDGGKAPDHAVYFGIMGKTHN